ncbi:hypothetical protein ACQJBY_013063 [Aegilops geniculata]
MSASSQAFLHAAYRRAQDDNLMKAGSAQLTYAEIPKFPYAYFNPRWKPSARIQKKPRPVWAPDDLARFSFLPTRPTVLELRNLFKQVRKHFEKLSPLTIESESKMFARAHSTRYPLRPPAKEKEDTYYIVRMLTYQKKKFSGRDRIIIEFLFKDVDNYLVAWRVIRNFAEFATALWCVFSQTSYLNDQGVLMGRCKQTKYSHSYGTQLENVRFYEGVLEMVEDFLVELYELEMEDLTQPTVGRMTPTNQGNLVFETLFVLFGENPRFGPLEERTCSSILVRDMSCAKPIGIGRLFHLIKNWRNLSYTTFCLVLLLLEDQLVAKMREDRPSWQDESSAPLVFRKMTEEVRQNRAVLGRRFVRMFNTSKGLHQFPAMKCESERLQAQADQLGPFVTGTADESVRGSTTLDQLIDNFLHLLRFDGNIVPGILARKAGYQGCLGLKFTAADKDA